ncbi:transketolase [Marispirochaeta sp.]|jgi:transketolase|uniref:transketolase n=1 Tax=Marispirochaeta sp. TaxID=2038653 RepID=UPI0029C98829|nr:transketolase [Marispirochaeta sp.]
MDKDTITLLQSKACEIRTHVLKMVYTAQSGHIGGSFSEADIIAALYYHILKINPHEPKWDGRDRFVLSKGHACPALYAVLAMKGYFGLEELDTLRQYGSLLQGHPVIKTPGIDMTSGSLGVGFASAVGIALDEKIAKRNDYQVYTLLGDGELNEGIVWEAAQTANKYRLNNLVAIVDRNKIQNDGRSDDIMPVEPIDKKFEAFGWKTWKIDGHNMEEIVSALETARDYQEGPVCIIAYTIKGKGVSFMEDDYYWHGKAPNQEQFERAMQELEGGAA